MRLKRQSTWIRFKYLGRDCAVQMQERLSAADCAATNWIWCGGKRLDLSRLPDGRLERLVPYGYAVHGFDLKRWHPFLDLAMRLGYL